MSALAKAKDLLRVGAGSVAVGPIGVDFALESIHLVQLEKIASRQPTVRARVSVGFDSPRSDLFDNPQKYRSLLNEALARGEFVGKTAVLAVPTGMFRTMSVNYKCSGESDDSAILKKMRDRLDGDLTNYVLDYLPVKSRSNNDEKLALVAVSERQDILTLLEATRFAGLNAEALEIGPVAISRLIGAMSKENHSGNVLVINSGRVASYLTLISGADLLFDQQIRFGENELVNQLAHTLDMTKTMARNLVARTGIESRNSDESQSAEDIDLTETIAEILKGPFARLSEEIRRVCLYAAAETRGGTVSQVYLLGSIARWPGAAGMLGKLTDVPVATIPDPLAPFDALDEPKQANMPAPEIAVATGLALRGMD